MGCYSEVVKGGCADAQARRGPHLRRAVRPRYYALQIEKAWI